VDSGKEARFAAVDVADPGQLPLVEQGIADGDVRFGLEPAEGFFFIPVRAEQIRPQMPDDPIFLAGWHYLENA